MFLYFILLRFPEWKALSEAQRRLVWQQCIHPLLTNWQALVIKTSVGFLALGGAFRLGAFNQTGTTIPTVLIVISLVPELIDLTVVARSRHKVSRFIETHGADLQAAS